MAKTHFEEWLWDLACAKIKHIHNSSFITDVFNDDCIAKHQSQSFSGVCAQYQNAHAEHVIQTIVYIARTFMLHFPLDWSEHGVDHLAL